MGKPFVTTLHLASKIAASWLRISVIGVLMLCLAGAGHAHDLAVSHGLAPEVTDLNADDVSYRLEHKLPYPPEPFVDANLEDRNDGITVGELGRDGGKQHHEGEREKSF